MGRAITEGTRINIGQAVIDISKSTYGISAICKQNGVPTSYPLREALIRLGVIHICEYNTRNYTWTSLDPLTIDDKVWLNMLDGIVDKCVEIRNSNKRNSLDYSTFDESKINIMPLSKITDDNLFAELRRRGFVGLVERKEIKTFEI